MLTSGTDDHDLWAIGIDWSGAAPASDQKRAIRLALVKEGVLCELSGGWTRESVTDYCIQLVEEHPRTVVGLDFAFSLPEWFLADQGWGDARDLWTWCEALHSLAPDQWHRRYLLAPFWGTMLRRMPIGFHSEDRPRFRRTENDSHIPGASPMSVFQISGNGAVGAQSMLGMVQLLRLKTVGCAVWPFDSPGWPLVVEIFPRLLVREFGGPDLAALKGETLRRETLEWLPQSFIGPHADQMLGNHDAFDAAVSAYCLWEHRATLSDLPCDDDIYRREGRIWSTRLGITGG